MAFVLSHKRASREAVYSRLLSAFNNASPMYKSEHQAAFVQISRICYEFSHRNANVFEEIREGNVVYFKCALCFRKFAILQRIESHLKTNSMRR